jgi:hypothetical protein
VRRLVRQVCLALAWSELHSLNSAYRTQNPPVLASIKIPRIPRFSAKMRSSVVLQYAAISDGSARHPSRSSAMHIICWSVVSGSSASAQIRRESISCSVMSLIFIFLAEQSN